MLFTNLDEFLDKMTDLINRDPFKVTNQKSISIIKVQSLFQIFPRKKQYGHQSDQ